MPDDQQRIRPRTRAALRKWLEHHHADSAGAWLVFDRKSANAKRLAYADAVEEALCFGWIDSRVKSIDDATYEQWFSPRKPDSAWSKLNKARIEKLTAAGLMRPAGLAAIDRAKANGAWCELDRVEALHVPDDLAAAFAANPAARAFFDALSPSAKKMILHPLNAAKRPETRAKRIASAVDACAHSIHPTAAFRARLAQRRKQTLSAEGPQV